ncbi:hypothetical protein ACJRO0_12905 [Acetobacter oryzifermentans]|uniref:hypothetical protein n=1 Tax=Acetobacter oryzifermentans TaxID=1633874 RepID=UPI0039BF1E01
MANHTVAPVYNDLKLISTPENIIRTEGMRRILACRRALMSALNDAINYGYSDAEIDELYEAEASVFKNMREWEAL